MALSKEKTQSVVKEEAIKVAERAAAAVLACPLGEDIHENEGLMPPHRQDGLLADVSGLKMETMVLADAVYNKELSWLAFNWRVLYMAVTPATPIFEVSAMGEQTLGHSASFNRAFLSLSLDMLSQGDPARQTAVLVAEGETQSKGLAVAGCGPLDYAGRCAKQASSGKTL